MSAVGDLPGNATTAAAAGTGTTAANRPTDLPTSARIHMEAVGADPQATVEAGRDNLSEVCGA